MKKIFYLLFIILILVGCKDEQIVEKVDSEAKFPNKCTREEKIGGIDVAFVIDSSGSMANNDPDNLRLEHANLIVEQMIEKDRAMVISFDKQARRLLNDFSGDQLIIEEALQQVGSEERYTNLGKGLDEALIAFEEQSSENKRVIIALTDGENAGETEDQTSLIDHETEMTALKATNDGTVIYTIGLGPSINHQQLEYIASLTGGKFYHAEENFDLEEVYREVLEDINCDTNFVGEKDEGAQYVIFNDAKLSHIVNESLGFPKEYKLTVEDIQNLTTLSSENVPENSIKSLLGLEKAKNLQTLNFRNQDISDISSLFGLSKLVEISLNHNDLGHLNLLTDKQKTVIANFIIDYSNTNEGTIAKDLLIRDMDGNGSVDIILTFSATRSISKILNFVVLNLKDDELQIVYNSKSLDERDIDFVSKEGNYIDYLVGNSGHNISSGSLYLHKENNSNYLILSHYAGGNYFDIVFNHYFEFVDGKFKILGEKAVETEYCASYDDECTSEYPNGKSEEKLVGSKISIEILENDVEIANISSYFDTDPTAQLNLLVKYATIELKYKENEYILDSKIRQFLSKNNFMKLKMDFNDSFRTVINNNSNFNWDFDSVGEGAYGGVVDDFYIATPHEFSSNGTVLLDNKIWYIGIRDFGKRIFLEDVEKIMGSPAQFASEEGPGSVVAVYTYSNQDYRFIFDGEKSEVLVLDISNPYVD